MRVPKREYGRFFFELNKRFEYEGKSAIMWEKELYYLNEYKYNSNLSYEFELGFFVKKVSIKVQSLVFLLLL